MGSYLLSELKKLESPTIKEIRGRGLFVGLEFHHDLNINGNHFSKILMKNGLLTKATHDHCIRFSPALVIKKEEIDEAVIVIKKSLKEFEQYNETYKKWMNLINFYIYL